VTDVNTKKPSELQTILTERGIAVPEGDRRTAEWKAAARKALQVIQNEQNGVCCSVTTTSIDHDEPAPAASNHDRTASVEIDTKIESLRHRPRAHLYGTAIDAYERAKMLIQQAQGQLELAKQHIINANAQSASMDADDKRAAEPKPVPVKWCVQAVVTNGERRQTMDETYTDKPTAMNMWQPGGQRRQLMKDDGWEVEGVEVWPEGDETRRERVK